MKEEIKERDVKHIKSMLKKMKSKNRKIGKIDLDDDYDFLSLQIIASFFCYIARERFDKELNKYIAKNISLEDLVQKLIDLIDVSLQSNALLLAINQKLEKQFVKTKK